MGLAWALIITGAPVATVLGGAVQERAGPLVVLAVAGALALSAAAVVARSPLPRRLGAEA